MFLNPPTTRPRPCPSSTATAPSSPGPAALRAGLQVFPDGVTHDLRYLEPFPIYVDRAKGAHKWDVDGHELIDYWSGHGALLLGHRHPAVVEAVQRAGGEGDALRRLPRAGDRVGRAGCSGSCPSAERVRFTGSRHRGDADGAAAGPHLHRPAEVPQVRRPLPRLARLRHPSAPTRRTTAPPSPASPTRCRRTRVVDPAQRPRRASRRTLKTDPQIGCVILEPTGGHWGAVPIRGAVPARPARADARARPAADLRRGHHRLPRRARRGAGALRRHARPDDAGEDPGRRPAGRAAWPGGPTCWRAIESAPGKPKMKHPGTYNANPLSAAAGVAALKLRRDRRAVPAGQRGRPRCCGTAQRAVRRPRLAAGSRTATSRCSACCPTTAARGRPKRGRRRGFIPYDGDLNKLDGPPTNPKLRHAFRQAMLLQRRGPARPGRLTDGGPHERGHRPNGSGGGGEHRDVEGGRGVVE